MEFTCIYLSETGVGQTIAERVHAESPSHGLVCHLFSADDHLAVAWGTPAARVLVIMCSSTGDGDPPAKAVKFWRWLRGREAGFLTGTRVAVLGLGDSNYSSYMSMPRKLRTQLVKTLGASECCATLEADDATPDGLETAVEPWLERLWAVLGCECAGTQPISAPVAVAPQADKAQSHPRLPVIGFEVEAASSLVEAAHVEPNTWPVHISAARWLTTAGALKRVLLVTLEPAVPAEAGPQWQPGDALAVRCPNPAASVRAVLGRLPAAQREGVRAATSSRANWPGHVPAEAVAFQVLSWHVDLGALPSKRLLRALAECCAVAAERQALLDLCEISVAGKERYAVMTAQRWGLPELLAAYPSCAPDLALLLALLPPLKPRHYSVAGLGSHGAVDICFTVVREHCFAGACTNWLQSLAHACVSLPAHAGDAVPRAETNDLILQLTHTTHTQHRSRTPFVFAALERPATLFRLPALLRVPVIMIGPGTGVAPFRSFLQHMEVSRTAHAGTYPDNRLYFGCRNREHDFLFANELHGYRERGVLSALRVAASREAARHYVQHLIIEDSASIVDALGVQGGFVFVCGDARDMAPAVHAALVTAFEKSGLTREEATAKVEVLRAEKRYLVDVWA